MIGTRGIQPLQGSVSLLQLFEQLVLTRNTLICVHVTLLSIILRQFAADCTNATAPPTFDHEFPTTFAYQNPAYVVILFSLLSTASLLIQCYDLNVHYFQAMMHVPGLQLHWANE